MNGRSSESWIKSSVVLQVPGTISTLRGQVGFECLVVDRFQSFFAPIEIRLHLLEIVQFCVERTAMQ